MSSFTINELAKKEIARLTVESGCIDPIASLGQTTEPVTPTGPLLNAILTSEDDENLRNVASHEFAQLQTGLKFFLTVFIFERDLCAKEDIRNICGVDFVMKQSLFDALNGLCLEFGAEGFVLRNSDGSVYNPFCK